MKLARFVAFLGGAFPIVLGYLYAPSPKYDPEHWGPCGLRSVFPVTKPIEEPAGSYCLDCYECVYEPSRIGAAILILGGLFALSGFFASRIAKTRSIIEGVAPAAASVALLLGWMAVDRDFEVWPTLLMGVAVWLSSIALAAVGAYLATSDA